MGINSKKRGTWSIKALKENRIDVLINSEGIWIEGPSDTMTEDLWDRCLDIDLKGTFFMCRYAIPFLEKTQGCTINVSSDSGLVFL